MPQLKAAKKALRVSQRRRVINDRWRLKFRESIHRVQQALQEKDKSAATKALVVAHKNLDKAARRNILHPNTAARKKSKLNRAVNSLD